MSLFIDDKPQGTHVFIQWKGTNACFDFWCECGSGGHFDGYFAYVVKCAGCGRHYEMPCRLIPRQVSRPDHLAVVVPTEESDGE